MCGILGGIFRNSLPATGVREAFDAAARCLTHRGPDDDGLLVVPAAHAVLAFRRLSIIDLATGHQPMSTGAGQHVIFNGEIYNYRDVRRELETAGAPFHTTSDTEVLLHQLTRHGSQGLSRLHGMWGVAFLDETRRRLILARDRLGIKQVYYCSNAHGLFFASEPKALLALPWVRREFNTAELPNYLNFRCVPSPSTLFRGINKLPPGSVLEHDLGTWETRVHRYWAPPADHPRNDVSLGEAVDQIEAALLESIRRRLIADVPVGALLSGGLDSSLVVAGMRRLQHPDILTFSATFPNYHSDESTFSRRVAERFDTRHHERPTEAGDFLAVLPDWVTLNDDLVADASSLPLLLVSRLARDRACKVLLAGEGADELFAGYGSYHKYTLLRRAARFLPSASLRGAIASALGSAGLIKPSDRPRIEEYFVRARDYLGTAAIWGTDDIMRLVPHLAAYDPPRAAGGLDELGAFDFDRRIPDDLLVRTDRATMGASIEARVPFLDHELVELAYRTPRKARSIPGLSKIALRLVARRWGVPKETILHRKVGFQIPIGRWFRSDLKPLWERMFTERLVPTLDYAQVNRIFQSHVRGTGDFAEMLWRAGALELWYRRWILEMPSESILAPPGAGRLGTVTPGAVR